MGNVVFRNGGTASTETNHW